MDRKNKIRAEVAADLALMTGRTEKSEYIRNAFLALEKVRTASTVAVFMSTKNEPDTAGIIACLLKEKRVFLPRVSGDKMGFVEITENTEFVTGAFGIREPKGEWYDGPIDVMAVPLVAFDDDNNRLGHGKGYYDKYLAEHSAYTVGLAFSLQKREIPTEGWDVPLNVILTDQYSK